MKNKICLITGANSGIGKAAALALAKKGATLVLVCRNEKKGRMTVTELEHKSGNKNIELLIADLSSQKSIRTLADAFTAKYDRLDVLINNAGVVLSELEYSEDNIEKQFATNHLGYFLLTNLLLDRLKVPASARIVNVSSVAHYRGTINFDDLNLSKNYNGLKAYGQAKLANVLFTFELASRLSDTGITVNCLHPGAVRTPIGQKSKSLFYRVAWTLLMPFLISPQRGAETTIYLASSPEVEGVTGKYFDKCKAVKSSRESRDKQIAAKLWQVSAQLTGLE